MAKVSENLRRFRQDSGLTQEQVAQKLYVTRQTVSGYESGRTQPDIETLQKLADIYGVELTEVIYGEKRGEKIYAALKITAVILLAVLLLLLLIQAGMLWVINRYYALEPGTLTDTELQIFELRRKVLSARSIMDVVIRNMYPLGWTALFVLTLILKKPVRMKDKLFYTFVLVFGSALAVFPWMWTDPIYGAPDYCFTGAGVLAEYVFFLLISLAVDAVRAQTMRRERKAQADNTE